MRQSVDRGIGNKLSANLWFIRNFDTVGEFPKQRTYAFYPGEFRELMRLRLNSPTVSHWLDTPKTLSSRRAEGIRRIWPYERVLPNERLRAGDIVYLVEGYGDLYAWGYATKVEPYQDVNLEKEMLRVSVSRPIVRSGLLSVEQIKQQPSLARLYAQPRASLTELDANQVKAFNQLIRSQGVESPADPSEDDAPVVVFSGSHRPTMERSFVLDQPVKIEERRYVEFKEIKGQNPVDSIKNTADEYAVALLNKEGGSIFWGVRDTDRIVVGVHLDYRQRDEIRRTVSQKLAQIQPSFPVSLFNLDFYPVRNEQGQEIEDLWIFEADIPGGSPTDLYATRGDEVFVKTDGGKQKLSHTQVIAEVERRKGLQRVEARDPDEDAMYAILAELTRRMQTNEGEAWYPGKEVNALKLAEKMVSRKMLEHVLGIPGAYTLPGRIIYPRK